MNWAIVTLTTAGAELGLKLQSRIPGSVLFTMPGRGTDPSQEITGSLKEFTASIFHSYSIILFIMAAGIVVRTISQLINDKTTDPGILVMDEKGRFVISLLSGHMGGANGSAEFVAELIGAEPVITTSSDINGMLSPDMLARRYGAVIDDMRKCKDITAAMVNGGRITLYSDYGVVTPYPYVLSDENSDGIVYLTNSIVKHDITGGRNIPSLKLIPRNIVIGAGCRRDTDPDSFIDFIKEEFELAGLDIRALSCLASIDIKSDEPAMVLASEYFNADRVFYSAEEIKEVEHLFQNSDFVRETTGAGAVAEPCAYLAAGSGGKLLLAKKSRNGMTLAIMERTIVEIE